jgi:hypothetical protein
VKEHAKLAQGEYVFRLPAYEDIVVPSSTQRLANFAHLVPLNEAPSDVQTNRANARPVGSRMHEKGRFGNPSWMSDSEKGYSYSLEKVDRSEADAIRHVFVAHWYAKSTSGVNWAEVAVVDLDGGRVSPGRMFGTILLTPFTLCLDVVCLEWSTWIVLVAGR